MKPSERGRRIVELCDRLVGKSLDLTDITHTLYAAILWVGWTRAKNPALYLADFRDLVQRGIDEMPEGVRNRSGKPS